MCRNKEEGRRCPCDTSAARRERRQNAKAQAGYASLATAPATPNFFELPEPAETTEELYTPDRVQTLITALHNPPANMTHKDKLQYLDTQLSLIGAGVEYIAETKFGAPTDEVIAQTIKEDIESAVALAKAADEERDRLLIERDEIEERLQSSAINRQTHPIIRERHAAWKEEYPELYEERDQKFRAVEEWLMENHQKRINGHFMGSRNADALLVKRNEAIKAALVDVGVQFANPETLKISPNSHKAATSSLKEALAYYPQEWVDASNLKAETSGTALLVKHTKGRAHYNSKVEQHGYIQKTSMHIEDKPEGWTPDPLDRNEANYAPADENGEWTDPKSGMKYGGTGNLGVKAWANIHYENSVTDTKPTGRGWEKHEIYEERYNAANSRYERTGNLITRWRRVKTAKVRSFVGFNSEITVSQDMTSRIFNNKGTRVALHEFAHRVEDSNSHIGVYEEAFVKRRAGFFAEGKAPETPTVIRTGRPDEKGYKDNFPSHYMGRVYEDTTHWEALSMGMETLFAGQNGAFAGMDNHPADADYKRFILGVLASSAKSSS